MVRRSCDGLLGAVVGKSVSHGRITIKRSRVYVDTSVIGGCGDAEFSGPSTRLMRRFTAGDAVIVVSDVTIAELAGAPVQDEPEDQGV